MATKINYANITPSTLLDAAGIDKMTRSIRARGKQMDYDIHLTACSILAHVQSCGNTTRLTALLNAAPRSTRTKGLCTWFEAHGPMTIDRKGFKVTLKKDRTPEDFDVEGACETPFWDFTEESEPTKVTHAAFIKSLQTTATGGTEKRPAEDEARHAAIACLRALNAEVPEAAEVWEELQIEEELKAAA